MVVAVGREGKGDHSDGVRVGLGLEGSGLGLEGSGLEARDLGVKHFIAM